MTGYPPTLLAVAHGTTDAAGLAEVSRLIEHVRALRPELRTELCWLDRAQPEFGAALARIEGPVVVVPILLSTGYHVKVDITAVVADRPDTAVAAQLGPDDRITDVVFERLLAGRGDDRRDAVLFSAGSSDPEAFEQLTVVAERLQQLLRHAEASGVVRVHPRFLTSADWRAGLPDGADVANYLLAPGQFNNLLRRRARQDLNSVNIADPIGAHPSIAAVVCNRFNEAAQTLECTDGISK